MTILMTTTKPIILASGSAVRMQMLAHAYVPFEAIAASVEEEMLKPRLKHLQVPDRALALAKAKAENVSKSHKSALVIGADQMCVIADRILSKPKNSHNATKQLAQLQNRTHTQYSAVCVYLNGLSLWEHVASATLTMHPLSDDEINDYIALDQPYESAGGYLFESYGKHLFSKVEGDHDTIMGMPLTALLAYMHDEGILKLPRMNSEA